MKIFSSLCKDVLKILDCGLIGAAMLTPTLLFFLGVTLMILLELLPLISLGSL
jgi:hypothetical protein